MQDSIAGDPFVQNAHLVVAGLRDEPAGEVVRPSIPQRIRQKLGLHPNTEVVFEIDRNTARIKKARGAAARGGALARSPQGTGNCPDEHRRDPGADAKMNAEAVLVDSNVLLDVLTEDPRWFSWSGDALARAANDSILAINPIIYAEVSIRFARIEDLEEALAPQLFERRPLPWEAAFLAGKCFLKYRRRGGQKDSLFPISTSERTPRSLV